MNNPMQYTQVTPEQLQMMRELYQNYQIARKFKNGLEDVHERVFQKIKTELHLKEEDDMPYPIEDRRLLLASNRFVIAELFSHLMWKRYIDFMYDILDLNLKGE